MVEISEIVDRKTLEAWLKDQPQAVSIAIASRAAFRVWPLLWDNRFDENSPTRLILVAPRAMLNASVALVRPTDALTSAARAAARAAFAVAAARAADVAAALAAAAAFAADAAAFAAIRSDCAFLTGEETAPQSIHRAPLWPDGVPIELVEAWRGLMAWLEERQEGWEVWFPIYEGFRDGKPMNWNVLEKIALIPENDWRANVPKHTNGIIAGIVADFGIGRAKTPQKEDLSVERQRTLEAQARFVLSASAQAEMTAGSVAAQLDFAISAYMTAEGTNELPDDLQVFADVSNTLKGLRHTVANVVDESAALAELEARILELEAENETLLLRLNSAESRNSVQTFFNHAVESGGKAFGPAALFGSFFFVSNYVDPGMYNALAAEFRQFKADWFL